MPWLWLLLAVFLSRAVLAWASEQVAFHAAAANKQDLRMQLFRHLQRLGPVYLHGDRGGNLRALSSCPIIDVKVRVATGQAMLVVIFVLRESREDEVWRCWRECCCCWAG